MPIHRPAPMPAYSGQCMRRMAALFGIFLCCNLTQAGAVKGMTDPHRVPGAFIVMLKRERILSLGNPVLIDPHERAIKSPKWQAATAAVSTEVAQVVRRLAKAHPHV